MGGCTLDAKCLRRSQSLIAVKAPTHGRFFFFFLFFSCYANRLLPELKAVIAEAHLSEPLGGWSSGLIPVFKVLLFPP